MTKNEFIRAKVGSYQPTFKQMVALQESDKTSELLDFMRMLHPNQGRQAQGSKGEVFGKYRYYFTIYITGILRTTGETGEKRFYPIK